MKKKLMINLLAIAFTLGCIQVCWAHDQFVAKSIPCKLKVTNCSNVKPIYVSPPYNPYANTKFDPTDFVEIPYHWSQFISKTLTGKLGEIIDYRGQGLHKFTHVYIEFQVRKNPNDIDNTAYIRLTWWREGDTSDWSWPTPQLEGPNYYIRKQFSPTKQWPSDSGYCANLLYPPQANPPTVEVGIIRKG